VKEVLIVRNFSEGRNTKEWGVGPAPWEVWMEQRCSHAREIHDFMMIPRRENHSVRATKMETANQKWPNLTSSNPVSMGYAPQIHNIIIAPSLPTPQNSVPSTLL
jgi:hypothetical protein